MKLREVLAAPFVLRSESIERGDGNWVRVVSYPELGCREEGQNMPEMMERLEAAKLRLLVDRCLQGAVPPGLPALCDPVLALRLDRAGLACWIPRLDTDVAELAGPADSARHRRPRWSAPSQGQD